MLLKKKITFIKLDIDPFIAGNRIRFHNTEEKSCYLSDGNSEHVAHVRREKNIFKEKKPRSVTALDLIKCLKQVK